MEAFGGAPAGLVRNARLGAMCHNQPPNHLHLPDASDDVDAKAAQRPKGALSSSSAGVQLTSELRKRVRVVRYLALCMTHEALRPKFVAKQRADR